MSGRISQGTRAFMRVAGVISPLFVVASAFAETGPAIPVNCSNGQTLTRVLSKLNRQLPVTILVEGTCTEFVTIDGFENLTIKGQSGATIQQPATPPPPAPNFVLSITGSRAVSISGISVHSLPSVSSGIGVGKGSNQILLQNINLDGSWGVTVYEESQVWLVNLNVSVTSGFAAISVFDKSDVHVADGLLQRPSNGAFNAGVFVSSGHVTIQGTTIRDMQQSISISSSGSVDLVNFDSAAAGVDVIIDNPSGTNFNGAIVDGGSTLNLSSANLRINNAGQPWGGNTGAVFVTNGSVLNAGSKLIATNSQGQGVIVTNNSHATLAGSSITGGTHGGLVVANLSTIDNGSGAITLVSGNATDLFCDSNSFITGAANLSGASSVNCGNLPPRNTVPLP
jgi:hypothetical protein